VSSICLATSLLSEAVNVLSILSEISLSTCFSSKIISSIFLSAANFLFLRISSINSGVILYFAAIFIFTLLTALAILSSNFLILSVDDGLALKFI